ncbi:MAG: hypothetical protein NTW80_04430 [Deltaproteobacteria bacterium]|nr:hypothetical protein [Deltaproteobacteria bacterium]
MAEVIDLERFRAKLAADQGFRTWLARFEEQFGPETRLQDLSSTTLLYLASPGEENLYVLFDLVMGARGLGGSVRFRLDDLEEAARLKIMDTAFALMDRLRFELMRRLGWVEEVPGGEWSLIQLVQQAWRRETDFGREVPRLAEDYPDFAAYDRLNPMDRAVFIRRLIPQAVETFRERLAAGEP